jgi:hypothetical protein
MMFGIGTGKLLMIMAGVTALAVASAYVAWGWYQDIKEENKRLVLIQETTEKNVELVGEQLEKDRAVRDTTTTAIRDLKGTSNGTRLNPSTSSVILDFNERMRKNTSID